MRPTSQRFSNSCPCKNLSEATRVTCPNLGSHFWSRSTGLENIKIERKDAHKFITVTAWEILWWGEILEECKKIFNQLITQRHDQMHSANTYIKHRSHMSWALRTSFLFLRQKRNLFKCYSEKNSQAGSNPRKWSMLREDPKTQNEHHFLFISSWPSKWTRHKHRKWNSWRHTHSSQRDSRKVLSHTNSIQVPNPIIPNTETPFNVIMENLPAAFEKRIRANRKYFYRSENKSYYF